MTLLHPLVHCLCSAQASAVLDLHTSCSLRVLLKDSDVNTCRGGVKQVVVRGPRCWALQRGRGPEWLARWRNPCTVGVPLMLREAHAWHRIEAVEVTGDLLETMRQLRQRLDVVAEVVLAENAGIRAEIEQKLRNRGRGAGMKMGLPSSCGGTTPAPVDARR